MKNLSKEQLGTLFNGKTIKKVYTDHNMGTLLFFEFTDGTKVDLWSSEQMGVDINLEQFLIDC